MGYQLNIKFESLFLFLEVTPHFVLELSLWAINEYLVLCYDPLRLSQHSSNGVLVI